MHCPKSSAWHLVATICRGNAARRGRSNRPPVPTGTTETPTRRWPKWAEQPFTDCSPKHDLRIPSETGVTGNWRTIASARRWERVRKRMRPASVHPSSRLGPVGLPFEECRTQFRQNESNVDATTGSKFGQIANGFASWLPTAVCFATSLEVGTTDDITQLGATHHEQWVHRHGDRARPDHAAAV